MLKKTKPVFPSRTTSSNGSPGVVFSITSWFEDVFSGSGRIAVFRNAIEPCSGPRKTWLKTRTVKKEFGPISKRKGSRFTSFVAKSLPFSRFKSRSIATFPLATIILSRVPVCPSKPFSGDCGAEFPELSLNSKSNGSARKHHIFLMRFSNLITRLEVDEILSLETPPRCAYGCQYDSIQIVLKVDSFS